MSAVVVPASMLAWITLQLCSPAWSTTIRWLLDDPRIHWAGIESGEPLTLNSLVSSRGTAG